MVPEIHFPEGYHYKKIFGVNDRSLGQLAIFEMCLLDSLIWLPRVVGGGHLAGTW